MKKMILLLFSISSIVAVHAQTETSLKCYGWSSELDHIELSEGIEMEGYDQALIDREDEINDKIKVNLGDLVTNMIRIFRLKIQDLGLMLTEEECGEY